MSITKHPVDFKRAPVLRQCAIACINRQSQMHSDPDLSTLATWFQPPTPGAQATDVTGASWPPVSTLWHRADSRMMFSDPSVCSCVSLSVSRLPMVPPSVFPNAVPRPVPPIVCPSAPPKVWPNAAPKRFHRPTPPPPLLPPPASPTSQAPPSCLAPALLLLFPPPLDPRLPPLPPPAPLSLPPPPTLAAALTAAAAAAAGLGDVSWRC
mmetsp:Transcript_45039/g.83551  ORF Transcript_45039/g.83551 Transcript_45039/m.83551 type:complete len:209 (+) Transcript_45039:112-738(+)